MYNEEVEVVSTDSLTAYLNEIRRYPLLDKEEETYLAQRKEAGDKSAFNRLVESNLRLVVNIAKKYAVDGVQLIDLIQEGNIGLMKAVEKFDPSQGNRLCTYATYWINQRIGEAVSDILSPIRLPLHIKQRVAKVRSEAKKLTAILGREPSFEELKIATDLSEDDLLTCLEVMNPSKSIDSPIGDEDGMNLGDTLASDDRVDRDLGSDDLHEALMRVIETLHGREKDLIVLRFGLDGNKPRTRKEVGQVFGVTPERVQMMEAQALRKLRNPVRSKSLTIYLA